MKKFVGLLMTMLICLSGFSQGNYDDVAVIVNDNSPVSIEIGNYFKQSRNIPSQNLIHIQTVTDEVIDTTEFRNIQYQIKNYILSQEMENTLNYLVTTKGVPFDIQVDSCTYQSPFTFSWCSSLESELTLLLSSDSTKILKKNYFLNPYYNDTSHFNRDDYDLLLVTRLDGYSKQDVFDLIDRTGPETWVNKQAGKFVFDISYTQDTIIINYFAGMMQPAVDSLNAAGWNTLFDTDTLMPPVQNHVIGFVGFLQQIIQFDLNFTWEKGSFSELMVTGPDFTFYDTLNTTGNLILPDLINEGCGGASGFVHATYGSLITDYPVFFTRYYSEKYNPFNLAESYYMATKTLSWMNIIIGDPKTTITTQGNSLIVNTDKEHFFTVFPNPASDNISIRFQNNQTGLVLITLINQSGQNILQNFYQTNSNSDEIRIKTNNLHNGLYLIGITTETGTSDFQRFIVRK